ncbi:MAG: hypothetical protein GYB68_12380 [Chloroflexi bacterium]|nr:hypothetical protein [Chloroflexota bacterium]
MFTHLVTPDGRLIGQHDAVPAVGQRPLSGWLSGEYLIDPHPITFREPYQGPAFIQVGLYDPNSFERLLTSDGLDALRLPDELTISD